MSRGRILYLVHGFPPYRTEPNTAHVVKYLGRQGWLVDVVHRHPGWGYNKYALANDPQLLAELPSSVETHPVTINLLLSGLKGLLRGKKAKSGTVSWPGRGGQESSLKRLYKSLRHLPDHQAAAMRPSLNQALRIIKDLRPDLLITSAPPFSVHLAGYLIKAITGIPWVCHSRDLFRYNPLYKSPLPWRRKLDGLLEKQVIARADVVTTVYPEATAWLKERYGKPGQRYYTVRNGYDEEDFCQTHPVVYERFTILHPGRLAADEKNGRTAYALLDGMQRWLTRRPELKEKVQLELIGSVDPVYQGEIEKRGLTGCVSIHKPLPIKEVIAHELGADLLLIILEDNPLNSFTAGGKIYESARTGKPILGIVGESSAPAKLIRQLNLGQVAAYGDAAAVAEKLETLYDDITAGSFEYGNRLRERFVEQTSFEHLAAHFGEIFEELIKR